MLSDITAASSTQAVLRHRTLRAKSVVWNYGRSVERAQERMERFVNDEVGVENVIAIAECENRGLFWITVWYRDHGPFAKKPIYHDDLA